MPLLATIETAIYRSKRLLTPIHQQLKDYGATAVVPNSLSFALDRVLSVSKDDFEAFLDIAADAAAQDEFVADNRGCDVGQEISSVIELQTKAPKAPGLQLDEEHAALQVQWMRCCTPWQLPVLHPQYLPACLWATIVLTVDCSYTCVFVPLGVGLRLSEHLWGAGWTLDFVAGLLFTLDFVVNMRTGFVAKYNGRRLVILQPAAVLRYYFRHGRGVVHALSALSWAAQVMTVLLAEGLVTLHDSRLYGLLTVLRLLRLARGLYMIKRLLLSVVAGSTFKIKYISLTTLTAVKILYGLAVLVNALGCLWYYVASVEGFDSTWVNNYSALARAYGHEDGILLPEEALEIPLGRLYLAAVYWALTTATTAGFGDIVPANEVETVIAMCVMLLGVVLYGVMLGAITEVIARVSAKARESALYRDKMLDVEKWMRQQRLPRTTKQRIRAFYQEDWLSAQVEAVAVRLYQELPHMLQEEMAIHLLQEAFSSVPLLRSLAVGQQQRLAAQLVPQHVPKGCYLARAGEFATCCWLLTEGMVLLTSGEEDIECVTSPALIGEDALLPLSTSTAYPLDSQVAVPVTPPATHFPRQQVGSGVGNGSPLFRVHEALRKERLTAVYLASPAGSQVEEASTTWAGAPVRRHGIRTGSGCIVWRLQAQELKSIMMQSDDR